MRVRAFELRLIAVALVVCWSVAAALVLLAYRPGGPLDLVVGLLALTPIAIALAGAIWPPVARGDVAFPAIVWLGILALLCLVPSITGVVNQLLAFGSRTLLPSAEAAYPWLLALFATSLFSGFGIARRLQGGTAIRRRRLIAGTTIAVALTLLSGIAFGAVAVANDVALRDRPVEASRFGPAAGADQPPPCDADLTAGPSARLNLHMSATVDLRPVGSIELAGVRVGRDLRWLGYVGHEPAARPIRCGADRRPGLDDRARHALGSRSMPAAVDADTRRCPGARGRSHPGPAGDGRGPRRRGHRGRPRSALPGRGRRPDLRGGVPAGRAGWSAAADLHRWRGQLDYWVFLDGQLGQVAGSVNGEATEIVPDALNGTVEVRLTATERGRDTFIYPPTR